MYSILLAIIYLAFISLGLPDSLIGSSWPVMYSQLDVPVSYAGIVTMIISGGTIFSSLFSYRLTNRFGAGVVTTVSVIMTAVALFGFSISNSFIVLCLFAIPYGLGAGAVDAALNNYVALHYASRHMSWLHCFWGVGAATSPYIMGACLGNNLGWSGGYRWIAIIQIVIATVLFISIPLWQKRSSSNLPSAKQSKAISIMGALKIPGVKYVLIAFFGYCAVETTAGLWASSYLVLYRGIDPKTAAMFASLFFLGITFGRLISGFFTDKLGDNKMIKIGIIIVFIGIFAVWIPVQCDYISLAGLLIVGLGCAPIYPAIIHSTPSNFGKENSQAIIGIQMASAYTGSSIIPPLFGLIADNISLSFFAPFLMIFALLILAMTTVLNNKLKRK